MEGANKEPVRAPNFNMVSWGLVQGCLQWLESSTDLGHKRWGVLKKWTCVYQYLLSPFPRFLGPKNFQRNTGFISVFWSLWVRSLSQDQNFINLQLHLKYAHLGTCPWPLPDSSSIVKASWAPRIWSRLFGAVCPEVLQSCPLRERSFLCP